MISPSEVARRGLARLDHRIRSLPVLVLFPHSRCNCRCVMCDIWKANRMGQEISPAELDRHMADLARLRVRWVVLSGGEPLMHSNLWALCRLIRALPARITLLSTGLLLERHAREVVHHCDDVIVSLDGSPEVHDRIRRVPGAFRRLAEGVAALKAARPGFPVTGRCVLQRLNHDDLPRIVVAAHEVGLDRISFLAADVSSAAFNRATPWEGERAAEVALSRLEVEELERGVEATIDRFPHHFASGFIAEPPERLRRLPRYFGALNGDGDFPENRCNAPWVSSVVEADGTVRPCFFHPELGNVGETPLAEILNGPRAVAFRKGLDVRTDPVCRKCVCTLHLSATAQVGGAFTPDGPIRNGGNGT